MKLGTYDWSNKGINFINRDTLHGLVITEVNKN